MNSPALPVIDRYNDSPWNDVRRIYRRICVLRAAGHPAEALDLELEELPKALAAARKIAGDQAGAEASVLAEEAERVTNASLLAELVAPLLADRLNARSSAAAASAAAPVSVSAAANRKLPAAQPAAAPKPAVQTVPSIADMLDGMLAQSPALSGAGARP